MATTAEKVNFEFLFTMATATRSTLRNLNKGFGTVNKQMDSVGSRATVIGRSLGGGVARGAKSAAIGMKNMLVSGLALAGVSSIFSGLVSTVPALGIALRTAGETIQRNLIAPIGRALIPVLIRLTNFVSANRTKFLALGAVILNVFRVLAGLAKNVVSLVSKLFSSFFDGIGLKAKLTFNNLVQFFNFILLKIAFLFAFISGLVEPVIKGIGKLFAAVFNNIIKPFLTGLAKGFGDGVGLMTSFRDAVQAVVGVFTQLVKTSGVKEFFSFLGRVIGTVLKESLQRVVTLIKIFAKIASALFSGIASGLKAALGAKGFKGMEKILKRVMKVAKILFSKVIIPAFKFMIPAAKLLGFIIGKSLGGAFIILGGIVSGVIRTLEFFTVDLPRQFRADVRAVQALFQAFKQGAVGLFFTVITPIKKIASVIGAIFSALVLLMKDFIARNVAPLVKSLSDIPGISRLPGFKSIQKFTTELGGERSRKERGIQARELINRGNVPTFLERRLETIAPRDETSSLAPGNNTITIGSLTITAQDSEGVIREIQGLPARFARIQAQAGNA